MEAELQDTTVAEGARGSTGAQRSFFLPPTDCVLIALDAGNNDVYSSRPRGRWHAWCDAETGHPGAG